MRKALIDNDGWVRNVILLDQEMWDAPEGLSLEDCEAAVGPGWRRTGAAFEPGSFEEEAA